MMINILNKLKIAFLMSSVTLVGCAALEGASNRNSYPYKTDVGTKVLYVSEARDECWLQLSGQITMDLLRAFRLAADDFGGRNCSTKWVLLNSGGGSVQAAYAIGKIIREKGLNTSLMGDGGLCASACGMLFIAGVKREIKETMLTGSRLGFHQISTRVGGAKVCIPPSAEQYTELLDYASNLLSPEGATLFVKLASETDCNKLSRYSYQQLKNTGIVTGEGGAHYRFF